MALTGTLFREVCYSSAAGAEDAYFTAQPIGNTAGSTSYMNIFQEVGGVWKLTGYSINSSGVWTQRFSTNASVPQLPACDPAQSFLDGMEIGWGVVAAMAAAVAIIFIRKSFFR